MRLLCRLGFHQWYWDSAFFNSVQRCNYCPKAKGAVKALEREREMWSEGSLQLRDQDEHEQ